MTSLTSTLTTPVFDTSTNEWRTNYVVVDENNNQVGSTIYFSAPDIDMLPYEASNELRFASAVFSGAGAFKLGTSLTGNLYYGAAAGFVGFVDGLANPMKLFFMEEFVNALSYAEQQVFGTSYIAKTVLGSSSIFTLPNTNDLSELYSIQLATAANDTITVSDDTNIYVVTDAGNDTIQIDDNSADAAIDGGTGTDTLSYANLSSGVDVDMLAGNTVLTSGGPIKDVFENVENITGSNHDDVILGDENANVLNGGGGDDTLEGGQGNDTINGGSDNDTVLYNGDLLEYDISESGGVVTIEDLVSSGLNEGTDTLTNVEIASFADKDVALKFDEFGIPSGDADIVMSDIIDDVISDSRLSGHDAGSMAAC